MATRSHGPVDDDNDSVGSRSLSTNGSGAYEYSIEYLGAEIPELLDRIEAHLRAVGCQRLVNADVLVQLFRRGYLCTSGGSNTTLSKLGLNVPDWCRV